MIKEQQRVEKNLAVTYWTDIRSIEGHIDKLRDSIVCAEGRKALQSLKRSIKKFKKTLSKTITPKKEVDKALHDKDRDKGAKLRDREDWTDTFSSTNIGFSPVSKIPIDKLGCSDKFCENLRTHYLNRPFDTATGHWTDYITERDRGEGHCPNGYAAMQIHCSGKFCGRLRLFCQKPDLKMWQMDDSATEEKGWFNERFAGLSTCSTGYVLYGLKCTGSFCHTKKLLCKGTKPPPRDCRWGPWTQWTECRGMCGLAYKKRNRTVFLPERYGGKCEGRNAERRRCEISGCAA